MASPDEQFDSAFRCRCAGSAIRTETANDTEFLVQLYIACSPLAAALPEPMLRQQALLQQTSHRAEFPAAMRRIVELDDIPQARLVIDWNGADSCHAVDIAVMPQARRSGIGWHLLHAWIEVADALRKPCTLEVLANNPARKIYERLNFRPDSTLDPHDPVVFMQRAVVLTQT